MASRKSNVEVAIRVRPMRAVLNETKTSWEINGTNLAERSNPESSFTFDRVYDTSSTTQQIYDMSVRDAIVKSVCNGYNGTVFAYGQTGSGKSFTMLGGISQPPEGIVTLAVRDLFAGLEKEKAKGFVVKVFVIMLEIYNEQLRDLLLPPGAAGPPLTIRENEHGVYVHNAGRRQVSNDRECLRTIEQEAQARVVGATSMNEHSSRSHCLIRLLVEKTQSFDPAKTAGGAADDEDDDEEGSGSSSSPLQKKVVSSLNLVDLAGSERVSKTGATGLRMVEGGHINKSLTTLTTVIQKMSEAHNAPKPVAGRPAPSVHIPFRDSKLTYLLKTAIGGNSFTTVICCITPADQHSDESRSTLQFASRAKTIRNVVVVNEVMDDKARIRELELKLKDMRQIRVASDLYLWAKDLKIKALMEQRGSSGDAEHVATLESLVQQLSVENESLREQAASGGGGSGNGGRGGGGSHDDGFADDEVTAQLRSTNKLLEQQVRELTQDKEATLQSLSDLEEIVSGMETELDEKGHMLDEMSNQMRQKQQEADSEMRLLRHEISSLQGQLEKLNELRRSEEEAMLHRARGDELLENLTKLHVEHGALQVERNTLLEMLTKAEIEKETREMEIKEEAEVAKLKAEQSRNEVLAMQSMLWRLIATAHLASHGEPMDPVDALGPVKAHVVDQAEKTLLTFISSRAARAPNELVKAEKSPAEASPNSKSSGGARGVQNATTEQLQKRIAELEAMICTKDAQRDVIIDTKLKRMQELCLRLYTTNSRLEQELSLVAEENRKLHDILKRDPKLLKQVQKEQLEPISEQLIRNRAQFAPVPASPFHHN